MNSRVGDESLLGAYGILVDSAGNMLHSSGMDESILQWFEPVFARSLAGEAVATSDYGIIPTQNMVFVSVPIRDGAQILGAIILFVPLYEAMTAMGGLVGALMLSLLVVLPFVFVMVFFLVRRIVNPLREMRDVAMAMAAGNFKVRASDEWRGEVGQLGRSLNYMAGELSKTISDVEFERNRLRYVVDGLSEGIIAVDQLGRVTHRNPALEEMLGVSEERLDNPEQIADDNIRDAFKNVLQSGEPASLQMEAPDKTKIIRVTITPIHDDRGETAGAVGMFLDIYAITILTIPILYPISVAAGWDAIWFGVILVKLMQIGMVSPPYGTNLFVTSSATGAIEPAELTVQGDLAIQNGAILAVTAAVQGDGTTAVSHVTTDSVNFTGSRVNIEVRLDAPDEAAVNGKPILTWSSLNGTTEVTAVVKVRNENGDWVDSKDYSVMKEGSRLVLRRASGRFWMILR